MNCPDSSCRRNTMLSVMQRSPGEFWLETAWLSSRRLARRAGRSGVSHARVRAWGPGPSTVVGRVGSGCCAEVRVEHLGRGAPAERLARAAVERVGDSGQVVGAVAREVGALGEVLPEQ